MIRFLLLIACSVAAAHPGAATTEETMMSNPAALLNRPGVRSSDYHIPDDLGRWQPWEAHSEAIGSHRRDVAQALGVSPALIERQCRSDVGRGTGKRTDGARMAMKVNCLRDLGVDENRAMLEVWWVLDFLGYRRPLPKGGLTCVESPLAAIGRFITESADVVREGNLAFADDNLTPREASQLDREAREVQMALDDFRAMLQVRGSQPRETAA